MNNAFLVKPSTVRIIGNARGAAQYVYLYTGGGSAAVCFCLHDRVLSAAEMALNAWDAMARHDERGPLSFIIKKMADGFLNGGGGDGDIAAIEELVPEAATIAVGVRTFAKKEGMAHWKHVILMAEVGGCTLITSEGEKFKDGPLGAETILDAAINSHEHEMDGDDGEDDDGDVVLGCGFLFDSSAGDLVLEIPINSRWECDNGNEPIALKNIGVAVQVMFEECQKDPGAAAAFADDLGRALLVFFGDALRKKWVGSPDTGKEKGDEDGDNLCFYFDIAKMPDFRAEHAPGWVRIERKLHIPTKEQVLAAHRI